MGSEMQERFYRPELDVLRFFAFLSVFVHHSLSRDRNAHGAVYCSVVDAMGFGLCLFFTLSAYLITLLLLREKSQTGDVRLRQFYLRRALRIWPLYLLALAGGLLYVLSQGEVRYWAPWFLAAMLMGGNLVLRFKGLIVGHLWSISLEEQFYVICPTMIRRLSRRHIMVAALLIIVLANATLVRFGMIHADVDERIWANTFVQFQMFAAGIILALMDAKRPRLSSQLSCLLLAIVSLLWFLAAYTFHIKAAGLGPVGPAKLCVGYAIVAIGCVLALIGVAGISRWPSPFVYLGKVSYGLYVYHMPVIALVRYSTAGHLPRFATIGLDLALTIGCAAISYRFFESPFLRLKRQLEVIKTRPV